MKRNVLVIGGGGREHALVWKMAQSPLVNKLYCAPGNAGIAQHAKCFPVPSDDIEGLLALAKEREIDLTVVGPELPLTMGIVDRFRAEGLTIVGPTQSAARIEGSKAFMKELLAKYGIPSAQFRLFQDAEAAKGYVRAQGVPIVVKASGLAAGKGAIVCSSEEEAMAAIDRIMVQKEFGNAGDEVVIEEFLTGEEASLIALVDGKNILSLAGAQDHKAIGEGDTGANTGGMGAYSPAPVLTPQLCEKAIEEIMQPTVAAMAAEGCPFRGILYAGLMIDGDTIKVLEFNARFGDPETQPILMRMKSDLVPLLMAAAKGSLEAVTIDWDTRHALCVVLAAGGYPGAYEKAYPIHGLEKTASVADVTVFHAATRMRGDEIITCGGRVLGVTALGETVTSAAKAAYEAADHILWKNVYYRRDIGYRAIARENNNS